MALNSKASCLCLCAHPKHWDCRRVPPCPVVFASSGYLISPRLLPSFLFVLLLFVSSLRGPRFLFCAGEWPSGQDITLAWIQKGQGIDKSIGQAAAWWPRDRVGVQLPVHSVPRLGNTLFWMLFLDVPLYCMCFMTSSRTHSVWAPFQPMPFGSPQGQAPPGSFLGTY